MNHKQLIKIARFIPCTAAATLLLVSTVTSALAAFTNGGFEFPLLPEKTNLGLTAGDTRVLGWIVGGESGGTLLTHEQSTHSIPAVEGSQYVTFNTGSWPSGGSIAQTFDTNPGRKYTVSFRVGKIGGGQG